MTPGRFRPTNMIFRYGKSDERWIAAVNQNLIEGGAYTTAELALKMEQVGARGATYGDAASPS